MASPGVRITDTPGAYERVKATLDQHAADSGTPKEAWYAYFNATGHLPQNLAEFHAFLDKIDPRYGVSRRNAQTGAITPLMPGVNPDPRLTPQDRGGFNHVITNAEDSDIERQQFVDPATGDIWGGSWDPAYNAAHPGGGDPNLMRGSAETMMNAQGVDTSSPAFQAANPDGQPFGSFPASAQTGGGAPAPSATPGGPTSPGGTAAAVSSGLGPLVDAEAYGNTQTLQAQIDDAIRRYALARTAEERNQAYMDLQRWQTELGKAQHDQSRYDAMAQALLSASVQLQNNPKDYFRFNQMTSGGRDIFAQMQQAGPAFAGTTGPVEPGSVDDLIRRLGIGPAPATPATPAGVLPGAANPSNPELPAIPVPGSAGVPGALQPGAGGTTPGATATSLPAYEQMLRELDVAAGGNWGGNRTDRNVVGRAWWGADPSRRSRPFPGWG